MIVLGITGSIGMGKSTIAAMLEDMGCPVHNSDIAVHEALAPGGAAFDEVIAAFPETLDKETATINRKILGALVFNNPDKRKKLEAIVHPAVWASQARFLDAQKNNGQRIVGLDIPLLYETGAEKRVDYVLVASAPHFIQKRRVLKRPNMNEEKFNAILATQMPDAEKRRRADFVVPTGLGLLYTRYKLNRILQEIQK